MAGIARSGGIEDSGAALLLVRFFRSGEESEEPRGELVTVARDLGALYPVEWQALLAEATRKRSRPARSGRKRRGRRRPRR